MLLCLHNFLNSHLYLHSIQCKNQCRMHSTCCHILACKHKYLVWSASVASISHVSQTELVACILPFVSPIGNCQCHLFESSTTKLFAALSYPLSTRILWDGLKGKGNGIHLTVGTILLSWFDRTWRRRWYLPITIWCRYAYRWCTRWDFGLHTSCSWAEFWIQLKGFTFHYWLINDVPNGLWM